MATAKTTRRKTASKKPPVRKKTTTRKVARDPVTPTPEVQAAVEEAVEREKQYDPQWHAKLEAYAVLKNNGVAIPEALANEVESWLAVEEEKKRVQAQQDAEAAAKRIKENEEGPKWIRNAYHSMQVLRLERQDKKRRIELEPRGKRGDIFPLEKDDLKDHNLIIALSSGYIEIIGQREAEEIVEKQTTNMSRVHRPLAILRNERGEAGLNNEGMKLQVETEYNSQGVVVGYIQQNQKGEINPKDPFGGIVRQKPEQQAAFVPTGGNPAIISSGFHQDPNVQAAIADDIARRAKGPRAQNIRPEEVLGLTVDVAPVVQT